MIENWLIASRQFGNSERFLTISRIESDKDSTVFVV
jgi:hypothetical protein